jgi:putative cardiolipin synthase
MAFKLKEILDPARTEAMVISPYVVPGERGMEYCRQIRNRGVAVKVLTNSLASTDETAPHGAYEKYRPDLLRCGVELYELRLEPDRSGKDRRDQEGSSAGAGVHAKCLLVDRSMVFVGSFNLDLRSVQMDTQNGVVVRSEELAGQLVAVFAKRTSPGYAYRVRLRDASQGAQGGRLVWIDEIDGKAVRYSEEPMTGPGRRIKAWFVSWVLPEAWF